MKVIVVGNRYFNEDQIRERMFTAGGGPDSSLRHGRYSDGFARRDEDAIAAPVPR